MMFPHSMREAPEKYSSFKNRKFKEYKDKLQKVLRGIEDVSLKPNHRIELKKQLMKQIESDLGL